MATEKKLHCFLCGLIFELEILTRSLFVDVNLANRNSLPEGKKQIYCVCVQKFEQTPSAVVVVWQWGETRWVRSTARRTQASEPRLTAYGLAAKRRGECARVNLSSY